MPWPKGVPRKGHVNKDGSTHAKWGEKVGQPKVYKGRTSTKTAKSTGSKGITMRKVSADMMDAPSVKEPFGQGAPEIHGARAGRGVTEPCPKCGFAYADGGHCPMADGGCGWTAPITVIPFTGEKGKGK
jgi:hypothetical protein